MSCRNECVRMKEQIEELDSTNDELLAEVIVLKERISELALALKEYQGLMGSSGTTVLDRLADMIVRHESILDEVGRLAE